MGLLKRGARRLGAGVTNIVRTGTTSGFRLAGAVTARAAKPIVIEGRTLDAHTQAMLFALNNSPTPKTHEQSPKNARRTTDLLFSLTDGPSPKGCVITEQVFGGVPCRSYEPHDWQAGDMTIVYFHGGGWVIGSVAGYDGVCRRLALGAKARVVSVEYRLAPEHPFPACIDDALSAFDAVRAQPDVDSKRLAVMGDSAGGYLSTMISLQRRGSTGPSLQALIYPGVEMTRSFASHKTFGDGFVLDGPVIAWFRDHYLQGHDPASPEASPWQRADRDGFDGVCPAIVITAGYDPLRDEGDAYAERMKVAGIPVEHWCEDSLVHGFVQFCGAIPAAESAMQRLYARVRAAES